MKPYNSSIKNLLVLAVLLPFLGCSDDNEIPQRNWQITWQDEFDGTAGQSPDASKWTYDLGRGENGWGNQELQSYTDLAENVSLDGNGNLAITATANFTSARIKTLGLLEQAYGRFEARIKLPWGSGIWPAFWMLGTDCETIPWPQCGEIDIMEYRGQQPTVIHGSVHGPGYSGATPVTKSYVMANGRFDSDFHVFAVEWGENYINYFVDDILYQQITPSGVPGEWVYNRPFYLILNVAVGGNFVGFPNEDTKFPQTMLVDWVRVSTEVD
jgi:beta-glucanase (GH16 family)